MTTTNAIVPFNPQDAVNMAIAMKQVVIAVSSEVLKENIDFGKIPGTDKNVLLKPGAERLCTAFKLTPTFEPVSQVEDFERGFFFYRYSCALIHRETGEVYGRGIGSCNSQEGKYGWRWTATPPSHLDKSTLMTRSSVIQELKFAIDKPTTTGKYGKPQEYWDMWKQAIDTGTARRVPNDKARKNGKGEVMETWEMGGTEYRIPNPDVFDLVNTIDKMAQKRALIAATLIATNASEFFTQDMEDFVPLPAVTAPAPVIVEGHFEEIVPSVPVSNGKPAWWSDVMGNLRAAAQMNDDLFAKFCADVKTLLNAGAVTAAMTQKQAMDQIQKHLLGYFAQTPTETPAPADIAPDADALTAANKDGFDIFPA